MTDRKPRSFEYYSKLRRTAPRDYYSVKTQAQMQRDAEALGQAFY